MKARTYRQGVKNGQVASRRVRKGAQKVGTRSKGAKTARSTAGRKKTQQSAGSRVLWLMVIIGAVMASGFIYSIRSQINVHKLSRMETSLKAELEEIANRQRYEILEQQRAISPQQSDTAARSAGLIQPKLTRQVVAPAKPVRKEDAEER